MLNGNAKYIVSNIISSEEKKYPVAPLITSTFQRIMSKQGVAPDESMRCAQNLYEGGYISYLRTDSVRSNDDFINETRDWLKSNSYEIPKKPILYKNKNSSQDGHECLRPTDITRLPDTYEIAFPDEKKVYETIWRYYVASQMMPAIYSTLKITANVVTDTKAEVRASGKALKSPGF